MLKDLLQKFTTKTSASLPDPQPLLAAMHNAALVHDSPESRARVYREFLKSWLWICIPELPDGWKPGMTTLQAGMGVTVATPTNSKGVRILPAFTDLEALANYDPNTPQMALPAIEVFKMAVRLGVDEVLVNAFDPVRNPIRSGGNLTRREFEALAQGMIPKSTLDGKGQVLTAKKPVQVQIGSCKTPMNLDARTRLQGAASQFEELNKIYRYRMRYVETASESEVFGMVCYAQGARFQQIVSTLMSTIQPFLAPDQYADFTQLRGDQLSAIQKHAELVYEK
jgi:SseB protein N-terminal domain